MWCVRSGRTRDFSATYGLFWPALADEDCEEEDGKGGGGTSGGGGRDGGSAG